MKKPFALVAKDTVTILRPMPSSVPRGASSQSEQQPTRSIRFKPEHLQAMDRAADILDMSRSSFITWCAYHVALDIIKQHTEFMQKSE